MTLSLERMARHLFGILTVNGAGRARIPRLDLMALNDRDLADLNLPADVRNRFMGQRRSWTQAARLRHGGLAARGLPAL